MYNFTYNVNDPNCPSNDNATVTVNVSAVMVTFTALADLCIDAGVQSGIGGGAPLGGV